MKLRSGGSSKGEVVAAIVRTSLIGCRRDDIADVAASPRHVRRTRSTTGNRPRSAASRATCAVSRRSLWTMCGSGSQELRVEPVRCPLVAYQFEGRVTYRESCVSRRG